jgi:amidohydrolase
MIKHNSFMKSIDPQITRKLVALRRELHQYPELSHQESSTAGMVTEWLAQTGPDKLLTSLGGHGVAAVYDSGKEGPTVLFRCELDALPIQETTELPYTSVFDGVGHLCGHDGHMAIILGLATLIKDDRPSRGRAILLFQPAEETGTGAALVIKDPGFKEVKPDYAFAIHNLPGCEMHRVVLADPVFSAGSIGMEIELTGKTSHAAEPENGINPAMAVSEMIRRFEGISSQSKIFDEFALITIIQVILGEKAFGTSAGHAILRATLRALTEKDFHNLVDFARTEAEQIGKNEGLRVSISTTEEFPVTENHPECTSMIRELAEKNEWPLKWLDKPFRWSEDFGHFSKISKSALIGLGSGMDQPKLHHPDYDFPDEIIPTGAGLFYAVYSKLLQS